MATNSYFDTNVQVLSVTIANGATTSSAVPLGDMLPVAITFPATLTNTSFTLQGSTDGGTTYANIYLSTGTAYGVTVTASASIPLTPIDFSGFSHVRMIGGSNEGGARTITIVLRRFR